MPPSHRRSPSRRGVVIGLGVALAALARRADSAGQRVLAMLSPFSAQDGHEWIATFHRTLADRGWQQGRDYHYVVRFAEGSYERLEQHAAELVALAPAVLMSSSTNAAKALQTRTAIIPIVFVDVSDPVGAGLAESLARPGRNATGLANLLRDLHAKRFQLLREWVPHVLRVAVLIHPGNAYRKGLEDRMQAFAAPLGLQAAVFDLRDAGEVPAVFDAMRGARIESVVVTPDPTIWQLRREIAAACLAARLPSVSAMSEHVDAGGLMSYGVDQSYAPRKVAEYVDRILRGARPGDLAIEQPTVTELVINRRTAALLGLPVPRSLLLQATRVVD